MIGGGGEGPGGCRRRRRLTGPQRWEQRGPGRATGGRVVRGGVAHASAQPEAAAVGPGQPFLVEAEAAGCRTLDGLGMLVNQGRIGIRYWTGVDPEPAVMRSALEAVFG